MERSIIDLIFYGIPCVVVIVYLYFNYKNTHNTQIMLSKFIQNNSFVKIDNPYQYRFVGSLVNILDQELKVSAGVQTITLITNEGFEFSLMPRTIAELKSLLDRALVVAAEVEEVATEVAMRSR